MYMGTNNNKNQWDTTPQIESEVLIFNEHTTPQGHIEELVAALTFVTSQQAGDFNSLQKETNK